MNPPPTSFPESSDPRADRAEVEAPDLGGDPFDGDLADDQSFADEEYRHPLARTIWTAVISVLILIVLVGAFVVVSWLSRETTTVENEVTVRGGQLTVLSSGADLRFVPGDATSDTVRISADVTSGLLSTDYAIEQRGDDVVLGARCRPVLTPGCGAVITIEVPGSLPINVKAGDGDLAVDGLEDRVVTVSTTSGDIVASGLSVPELSASTTSGDITADFASQPFAFKARTADGDVSATVPDGDVAYRVELNTIGGEVENAISNQPDGDGLLSVRTDDGDITVRRGGS